MYKAFRKIVASHPTNMLSKNTNASSQWLGFFQRFNHTESEPTLVELAQKVSVNHPEHGELFGPFLHTVRSNMFKEILKDTCIDLKNDTGSAEVLGYFPDLQNGVEGDFSRVLDLLERGDLNKPSLIFYTKHLPKVVHHQFSGVEVCWPKGDLSQGKLNIVPVATNEHGDIRFQDNILASEVKALLENAIKSSPKHENLYSDYLNRLFKESSSDTLGCRK
ncbi:hypothetical protein [Legionella sp. WA2022007384]